MSIRNWFEEKIASVRVGAPVKIANDGKSVDVVTIRYKDLYFFVDIDTESSEPTGDFGWSEDPTMNPTVPIREIWTAQPPTAQPKASTEVPHVIDEVDEPNSNPQQAEELQPIPMINGLDCPACGHPTLILGNGGYVTCSLEGCPNPDYAEANEAKLEAYAAEKVAAAQIEEIEDIDQSRDIEVDAAGIIWCTSCEMVLEDPNDKCGCNRLYDKRRQRVAKIRTSLATPGESDSQEL